MPVTELRDHLTEMIELGHGELLVKRKVRNRQELSVWTNGDNESNYELIDKPEMVDLLYSRLVRINK